MNNTKMPEKVFISDKWDVALRGGRVGMAAWIKCEPFPHEYIRADLVPQWIKCSERMPEADKYVLVLCGDGYQSVMFYVEPEIVRTQDSDYHEGHYWSNEQSHSSFFREFDDVTHWQPLPANPTEEV